jgi:serine protease Do
MVRCLAPVVRGLWRQSAVANLLVACCLAAILSFTATVAQAQVPIAPVSKEQRDRQYQQLADDVKALERQANLLKRVVKLVRPAVVHIEVHKGGRSNSRRVDPPDETGSGVIIERNKGLYVLTNRHLIRYAATTEITITLSDGGQLSPTRTWTDAGTDIAVMAMPKKRLLAARIGDSDKTEIGDHVLAIGSPFGLNHSVTYGIVSAKGRRDLELATDGVNFQDFMQIDASINPGNSGGPLVNLRGEVIGINTAIASTSGRNEGIGFSIPINMAMSVGRQLIDKGVVVRGFLGVSLDSRFGTDAAAKLGLDPPRGARVTAITTGSAAEKAEVRVGDVIVRLGRTWIEDDSHLVNQVSLTAVGDPVPMIVFRDGKKVELTVRVGVRDIRDR